MKTGPANARQNPPVVLVISGNHPSGGAGQSADVQAITAMSCHPAPVLTSLTVQDTSNAFEVLPIPGDFVVPASHRHYQRPAGRSGKNRPAGQRGNRPGGRAYFSFATRKAMRRKESKLQLSSGVYASNTARMFIINDDPELAVEIDVDGVHVGKNDIDIGEARALAGSQLIIGASCYDSFERAGKMKKSGADYLAFGSFYHSRTKPAAPIANIGLLQQARVLDLPLVAIGGVDESNGARLIEAGTDILAVISDVFYAEDSFLAASNLSALFARNPAIAG